MLRLLALLLLITPTFADDIIPDSFASHLSLKLTITNVSIKQTQMFMQGMALGDPTPAFARISYTIENNSGVPLGMALKAQSISAGPCHEVEHASGLDVFNDAGVLQAQTNRQYRERAMRLVLSGSRVSGTIEFNNYSCRSNDVQDLNVIPINITVLVSNGSNVLLVPLEADGRLYHNN